MQKQLFLAVISASVRTLRAHMCHMTCEAYRFVFPATDGTSRPCLPNKSIGIPCHIRGVFLQSTANPERRSRQESGTAPGPKIDG